MRTNKFILATCILTETEMIENIKTYADQIFSNQQTDQQISLQFSFQQLDDYSHTQKKKANNLNDQIMLTLFKAKQRQQIEQMNQQIDNRKPKEQNFSTVKKKSKPISSSRQSQQKIIKFKRLNFNYNSTNKQSKSESKQIYKNKKKNQIESRYKKQKPIMEGYSQYIKKKQEFIYQSVYQKAKIEDQTYNQLKKIQKVTSHEKRQNLWKGFLNKNQEWAKIRQKKIISKMIEKNQQQSRQAQVPPRKKYQPKPCSTSQCIRRIKKKTQQLKERLMQFNPLPPRVNRQKRQKNEQNKIQGSQRSFQQIINEGSTITIKNIGQLNFIMKR